MKKLGKLALSVLLLAAWSPALAQSSPSAVSVTAKQVNLPDGATRYEYQVVNHGAKIIVALIIGAHDDTSELATAPRGWDFSKGLSKDGSTSPRGWHVIVVTTEEAATLQLEWRNDGTADIRPGQSVAGFSIVTPRPDPTYLNGHWTVIFSDSTVASGLLQAERSTTGSGAPAAITSKNASRTSSVHREIKRS